MKFVVPNYSCLQNPCLRGYRPQIPVVSVLCPQLNLLNPPHPKKKFLGTPLRPATGSLSHLLTEHVHLYRNLASAGTYRDSCGAQDSNKRNALYNS